MRFFRKRLKINKLRSEEIDFSKLNLSFSSKVENTERFSTVYRALKSSFKINADDLVEILGVTSKNNIYAFKRGGSFLSEGQWKMLIRAYPSIAVFFEETADELKDRDILFQILKTQKEALKEMKKSNEILVLLLEKVRVNNPKV